MVEWDIFVTFINDFSIYAYVYLLRIKEYREKVKNQTGKKIKELRPDRGGEYNSQDFDNCNKELGIVHYVTPCSHESNRVVEQEIGLVDMVNAMQMLIGSGLP